MLLSRLCSGLSQFHAVTVFLASANLLLSQFSSGLSQLCLSDSPQLGCQFSILCFCSWLGDFAVLQVSARLAIELWCCGCIYCRCRPLQTTHILSMSLSTGEDDGQCSCQCPRVLVKGCGEGFAKICCCCCPLHST